MKLRNCGKYIFHMIFISFIALLSINFIDSSINRSEDKQSRIIIKSIENQYVPKGNGRNENNGVRVSTPVINGKSCMQLLPVPDANSPIIFSPLS